MSFVKSISSELTKLKYAPILWLVTISLVSVSVIVFMSNYMDVNSVVKMGQSPWSRNLMAGHAIFSIFILIPFCVMFISTAVFVENHASGWKFIYTAPKFRTYIFYSKLVTILVSIFFLLLLMQGLIVSTLYILDFIMPEFEFRYFQPDLKDFFVGFVHTYICLLYTSPSPRDLSTSRMPSSA